MCLVQSLELEAERGGIQAVSKHRAMKREIVFIDLENRESTNKIYKRIDVFFFLFCNPVDEFEIKRRTNKISKSLPF